MSHRRQRHPFSSKRYPFAHISADEIRSLITCGWRVRSRSHGVYVPVQ